MNIWSDQLENQMMNLKGFSQAQYFYLWLCINSKWANALEWLYVFSTWCVCVRAKISGRVLSVGGVSPERNWRNIIALHCQLHCRTPCWGNNRILARTRTHCPTLEGYDHLYTNLAIFQVDIGIFTAYQPGNALHLQHDGIISWTENKFLQSAAHKKNVHY